MKSPSMEKRIESAVLMNIKRYSIVKNMFEIAEAWLDRHNIKNSTSLISQWFYTQKLTEIESKDFVVPSVPSVPAASSEIKSNSELKDSLLKYRLTEPQIALFENLLHQMCLYFHSSPNPPTYGFDSVTTQIVKRNKQNWFQLTCQSFTFVLNEDIYQKLVNSNKDFGNGYNINTRIFNLICRYNTLKDKGYHQALLPATFQVLKNHLKINHELFASPFNNILDSYTSMYPDTDSFFGSKGNFFEVHSQLFKNGGSFQAHPPAIRPVISAFLNVILEVLKKKPAVSFALFLPGGVMKTSHHFLKELEYNILPQKYLVLRYENYALADFYCSISSRIKTAKHDLYVYILQNEAGRKLFPMGTTFEEDLNGSF